MAASFISVSDVYPKLRSDQLWLLGARGVLYPTRYRGLEGGGRSAAEGPAVRSNLS